VFPPKPLQLRHRTGAKISVFEQCEKSEKNPKNNLKNQKKPKKTNKKP
jgi:hypothetical protein